MKPKSECQIISAMASPASTSDLKMPKTSGLTFSKWSALLMAGDVIFFSVSVVLGLWLGSQIDGPSLFLQEELWALVFLGIIYITVLYIGELYNYYLDFRQREHVGQVILWALGGALVAFLLFCFPTPKLLPRRFLEWQALAFIWLLVGWRYLFSTLALPERLKRRVIIVGAGRSGQRILEAIRQRPNAGLEPVGFVDDDPAKAETNIEGLPVLGDSRALESLARHHKAKIVVVAITHEKCSELVNALTDLSYNAYHVLDMPSLFETLVGKIPTGHISDAWFLFHGLNKSKVYYRHCKRLLDLVIAGVGLALTWPLFLCVAAAIKLDSPGPVFYRQDRLGKDRKPFSIIKFRTMIDEAENCGPCWAVENDPRITRVGHFLRRWRLDELPQLINVLKGEMSFVGPRPEREVFIREFQESVPQYRPGRRAGDLPGTRVLCGYKEQIPYYSYRLMVRPGITGWAQVMHYYTASLEETREKLQYDLYYIKNMSFLLDLVIFLKTIRIVLFGRGR
jgi:exopolysaccharide biosynthesis polyprenyl glycosylphosphotransferase